MCGRALALVLVTTITPLGAADAAPSPPKLRATVRQTGVVTLRWTFRGTTDTQTTMRVERAMDAGDFAPLATVSAPRRRQTWLDASPPAGTVHYRVEVVSDAGTSGWSNVASVEVAGAPVPGSGAGGPPLAEGQHECPADTVEQVVALVNAARADHGIRALAADTRLARAARAHTIAMAASRNLSHDGWLDHIRAAGYAGGLLGENIAYGYPSASAVVRGWLGSSGHRANILNGGFVDTGVGCVVDPGGRLWWTEDFGG
ncbi:MAG TPA: CAP domain-containing protein [Candidatus Binatia bacterium]|nr:CAP domain-containing protein [Candidatus Binatia bacterium]